MRRAPERGGDRPGLAFSLLAAASCAAALAAASPASAQSAPSTPTPSSDDDLARHQVVVITAPSDDGQLRTVPHSVSVITAEDIRRSPATSIVELLGREANLTLRSYYGSDKYGGVDMRGMGDTAGSNVLILVDGVRLNEVDLSGADLSSLSLSQIERIEIVRGGGAVQHGNGAVAGVINIITRRARTGSPALQAQASAGSYRMHDVRLQARGGVGPLGLGLSLSDLDSDGYRDNGYLRSRNAALELRLVEPAALEFLDTWLRLRHHEDRNGFPGPVSAADMAADDEARRRATQTPLDFGKTRDWTATFGLATDFKQAGRLDLQASRRERVNDYVLGYSELKTRDEQLSTITSNRDDVSLRYDVDVPVLGRRHTLSLGATQQRADYARNADGREIPDATRKLGDVRNDAAFTAATLRPADGVALTAGWRVDRFRSRMVDERYSRECTYEYVIVPPLPFPVPVLKGCTPYAYTPTQQAESTWRNRGAELGASWTPGAGLTWFASLSRHFRNPNVDELVLSSADLHPQRGRTVEAGGRWSPRAGLELGLTLFRMRVHDEIYYGADPASGSSVNRNYGLPTQRHGAEVELRWQALPTLALRANAGRVVARFDGADADVPLVPRTTANLQGEWTLAPDLRWSVALRHVGRRYDGNDFSNHDWPQLGSFTVVDTGLRWQLGAVELAAGVNNLGDRAYSTLGYSATYYPMPGRNAFARIGVKL